MSERHENCPFCAAAAGASTTPVVYESAEVIALFPENPAARGHTLLIPRRHVTDLRLLDQADTQALANAVLWVAEGIRQGLQPDGLNIVTSFGAAASQTVAHLHTHLVPRWHGDEFGDIWPRPSPAIAGETVEAAAQSIRAALDGIPDG